MTTSWRAGDDVIEAIVRGDGVEGDLAPLAAFARGVRAMGDGQAPSASVALAALFVPDSSSAAGRVARSSRPSSPSSNVRSFGGPLGKVAGLSLLAKIGLGTSVAAASVASADAAGVLPEPASDAVRGAIEVVSPVEFDDSDFDDNDPASDPANIGDTVSDDATGESDGENGVDGQEIREQAPGADNRDSGSGAGAGNGNGEAPAAPPGQTGETGLDRAEDTPAGEHIPAHAGGGGDSASPSSAQPDPACGPPDRSVPSTVPPAADEQGKKPC